MNIVLSPDLARIGEFPFNGGPHAGSLSLTRSPAPIPMVQPPPPPPPRPATPAKTTSFTRAELLRREIAADGVDAASESVLRWELGRIFESEDDPAGAVKEYLLSFNLAPDFRPPLDALVRMFAERNSHKNLKRLLEARIAATESPEEVASAQLDYAAFAEHVEGDPGGALEHIEKALETDHSSRTAALGLERFARRTADPALLQRALVARAGATQDPVLKALFLNDLARCRQDSGDIDGAIAALDEALLLPVIRWRTYEALQRLARRAERPLDLARALESLADLAIDSSGDEGSGTFSTEHFGDQERASGEAAAMLVEAARLRLKHDQPDQALSNYARASALAPDDLAVRRFYIAALRAAGNADGTTAELERLSQAANKPEKELLAAFLYDAAFTLHPTDHGGAMRILRDARGLLPGSATLEATEDIWLLGGGYDSEWIESAEALEVGENTTDDARLEVVRKRWRAAVLACLRLDDFERGVALFRGAAADSQEPAIVWRDLYELSLAAGQFVVAQNALLELTKCGEMSAEEQSAAHYDQVQFAFAAGDADVAAAVLTAALDDDVTQDWSADLARSFAATESRWSLLARAHSALAEQADSDDGAAAFWVGAARAFELDGKSEAAERALRAALERVPGHRYSVALLEEALREQGKTEEVVALLRGAADAQAGNESGLLSLLLAGAAAEASGNFEVAAETYEQAADHAPTNVSPLWSLVRLGARQKNHAMMLTALEALSERECADGAPSHATLAVGEHYAFRLGKPELAEGPLERCLDSADLGLEAAMAICVLPESQIDPKLRVRALQMLVIGADAERGLIRELLVTAESQGLDPDAASGARSSLLSREETDGTSRLTSLLNAPVEKGAESWLELSDAVPAALGEALTLQGLRAMLVSSADVTDDAFMLAQELMYPEGEPSINAALAADETLEASDDADPRVDALLGRLGFASDATAGPLRAAAARAATSARRPDAVELLQRALEDQPDDLATWEAMRVAARDLGRWALVAESCDRLAAAIDGSLCDELMEEGAAVRMDHLGDDAGAQERLAKVFERSPSRIRSYHRLHDLLAEANDTVGIAQLVTERIAAVDDGDELARLFYEQARLYRSHGELADALFALENLAMLEDGHVGGIALAIEIHVAQEDWDRAIGSLRELAEADVPGRQKRIALLGAADFLEHKKNDPEAAYDELEKIEALGFADNALRSRMASLAVGLSRHDDAVRILLEAADGQQGSPRAELLRQAAAIQNGPQEDAIGALLSYRQALSVEPTDLPTAIAIAKLLPAGATRSAHAADFASNVRSTASTHDLDPVVLNKLFWAAEWQDDVMTRSAINDVLRLMQVEGGPSPIVPPRKAALPPIQDDALSLVFDPALDPATSSLAKAAEPVLSEMAGFDLGKLGVSRRNILKSDPVADLVRATSAALGVEVGEVYRGGDSPLRIIALPGKRGKYDWVLGQDVQGELGPAHLAAIGRHALAARLGVNALSSRSAAQAAGWLSAACQAAGIELANSDDYPGGADALALANRAIGRRTRKAIQAAAGPTNLAGYTTALCRTLSHIELLASEDLSSTLTHVLDAPPTLERILASRDGLSLVFYWLDPNFISLRKKLADS